MERFGLSRILLILSLCVLGALVSCRKPEKPQPTEELSWEELFLFEYAQGGRRYLFNRSSELEDPGVYDFGRYGAHNLFDNDHCTCWAEGITGDGVGEFVYFEIEKGINRIWIVNGYGKSKDLFNKNNRVKKLKANVYVGINKSGDATELGLYFQSVKLEDEAELSLDDKMEEQAITFPFDWSKIRALRTKALKDYMVRYGEGEEGRRIEKKDLEVVYLLWLEIVEVYKGSKCDDCCVSEIIGE
jgi:hypothetical protein